MAEAADTPDAPLSPRRPGPERGSDHDQPGNSGEDAADDISEVVIAKIDPADSHAEGEQGGCAQRDQAHAAPPDRPQDQRKCAVKDDRIHRMAARKAAVSQHLRPPPLRAWARE